VATEPKTYRVSAEVDREIGRLAKIHGGVDKALRVKLGLGAAGTAAERRERAAEAMAAAPVQPAQVSTAAAPQRRETNREAAAREKQEREDRARSRSSIGDDPSFCVDDEFVQG
jgi:hypothetical protein